MAAVISAFLIVVIVVVLRSNPRFIVGATSSGLGANNNEREHSYNLELKLVSEIKRGNNKIEDNFFKVKTLYDPRIERHLYLFNPIIVRLQMTPVILAYPLNFAHLVNNRPYNLILGNQHECRAPGMTTICGKRRGHSKNQGFCCPHVLEAHCFMYDPVWYSVNTIDRPLMIQVLGIQIYEEQFSFSTRNSQWKIIAEASTLLASGKTPSKLVNKENYYLSARMLNITKVGNKTCKSCLDYESSYLLIPTSVSSLKKGSPQYDQVNGGASTFLVVNRNILDFEGRTCGAVGVTEEAFLTNKYQCTENFVEECLQNQPMDLWFHDEIQNSHELKMTNRTQYFLSKFVKLFPPYLTLIPSCSTKMLLLVESLRSDMTTKMEVNLVLEADAKLQKSVVLSPVGIIGTIYSCPLVDGAKEHEIGINILNTGILSGKYNVLLKCNTEEQSQTIILAPYESQTILFYQRTIFIDWPDEIVGTPIVGNSISGEKHRLTPFIKCRLKLWSNEEKNQMFKTFFLEQQKICICLLGCKCSCGPEYKCEPLEQESQPRRRSVKMSAWILIAAIFSFILFLNLLKVFLGLCFPKYIGEAGLCLFIQGNWLGKYHEEDLKYKYVQYDEKGYPIDPDTGKRVRGLSRLKMSLINLLFFFYLPFVGLHWVWKIKEMKRRETGNKVKDNYEADDVLSLTSLCDSDDGHNVHQDISKYVNEETILLDDVKSKQGQKYYVSSLNVDARKYKEIDLNVSTKDKPLNKNTSNNLIDAKVGTVSYLDNVHSSDDDKHKNMSKMLRVLRKEQKNNIKKNLIPEREELGICQLEQPSVTASVIDLNTDTEEEHHETIETEDLDQVNEIQQPHEPSVRFHTPVLDASHSSPVSQDINECKLDVNSNSVPTSFKGGLCSSANGSDNEEQILAKLLKSNPVYFNHPSSSPFLKNSGECFSLCGNVEKRENAYIFRLGSFLMQTYEVIEDSVRALESNQILIAQAHKFVKVMDAEDVLQCITEKPKYPCLNLPNYIFTNDH